MLTYVDDNLCVGHTAALKALTAGVVEHGLQITVEHGLGDYLSCEIRLNPERTKAWLGQPHMVKKIDKTFGKEVDSKQTYQTPGSPGLGLVKVKEEENKIEKSLQSRYRTGVGMLLYLIKHSRPDLCNAVRELSKCLDDASQVWNMTLDQFLKEKGFEQCKVEPCLYKKKMRDQWILIIVYVDDLAYTSTDLELAKKF